MIQLNFLNAVAEDDGSGLTVNGKNLTHIISLALGTIKRIPGRYDYLKTEDKSKPFNSKLCNVSVTIDDRSSEITETITYDDSKCDAISHEVTLDQFEKGVEDSGKSQEVKQADPEE